VGTQRVQRRHAMPGGHSHVGQIIGGIVTADLTGGGYNDVLVPTTNGLVIYDGRTAQVVATLGAGSVALQNSADGHHRPQRDHRDHHRRLQRQQRRSHPALRDRRFGRPFAGRAVVADVPPESSADRDLNRQPAPGQQAHRRHGRHPDGGGYWNVASDGGIFAFGDAGFYGSMGGQPLNKPVVGMAATPDGGATGRWPPTAASSPSARRLLRLDRAASHLNKPVVGMAATPDGKGYWLVASDGGIFAFGDAGFYGSMGGIPSTSRWWAWPPPPTATATGWWPPTAASSPSVTPASTARPATSSSTSRWWAWPPTPTAAATGWWPPTAASSPSATPASTAPWVGIRSTSRWWAWRRTGATATGWWPPTAACSPSGRALLRLATVTGWGSGVRSETPWPGPGTSPSSPAPTAGRLWRSCRPVPTPMRSTWH
jgi:hypothetical protein